MNGVWASVANDLHQAVLSAPAPPPPQLSRAAPPPPSRARGKAAPAPTYVVRRGESLVGIARKFGCRDVRTLAQANGIKPRDYSSLHPGRVLQVGTCTQ
jgi:membrane-bound lytic murein transglycosylase D